MTTIRGLIGRLDRSTVVALATGVVLTLASIPLQTLVALVVGLAAAALLGFFYPESPTKVGVAVAAPVLTVAYLLGVVRGFSWVILLVLLIPSLILPVWLARVGASIRSRSK
ncbi:MAG: hypothetical protein OEU32_07880 [Acidimicrobiia bacterium]|nr:hypothetical protein [Acidimicrobiia bacterium]